MDTLPVHAGDDAATRAALRAWAMGGGESCGLLPAPQLSRLTVELRRAPAL